MIHSSTSLIWFDSLCHSIWRRRILPRGEPASGGSSASGALRVGTSARQSQPPLYDPFANYGVTAR
jgi:hypothetical protein